jgi:hypothetical protein
MLRHVDEPASHLAHSDQSRKRRKPQGALVERRRGQSLQRLRDAYASAVVVLGSAACTSRKPRAVCGSVTSIPARTVLAGMRAQSPVRLGCDGLAHGPSPQQRPGVGSRPPAARLAGCNPAAAAHRAAGPAERCAGPGQWADSLGPPAARAPWPSWMLAAGLPSAVTEFGSQWPSRWRRLATARGRFPEMQKWAQLAEESGSIWARPREACHPTPSQWRARHTGATLHLASRNKRASREQSPAAVRVPTQPSRSSQVC